MKDLVLISWIIRSLLWDIFLIGGVSYIVFWKGHSGWWFILAILLGIEKTLYKVLEQRFDLI